jgi:CheY-like chemotaxis protein
MDKKNDINPIILVVEDVQETREGIEKLLLVDGYRILRDDQF